MSSDDGGGLALRVAEAKPRDAGRGTVRLDPEDSRALGVEIGDIVEIQGKRRTVAKVLPAYMEDRGRSTIQMDGLIRGNAQVSLDERVTVRKASYLVAEKVVLKPLTLGKALRGDRDASYIGTLLSGIAVVEGDVVRANLFGTRSQEFVVSRVVPAGAVVISSGTKVEAEDIGTKPKGLKVSYEDVGGLRRELQRIREIIELPLKYPQVFERLGIDPPKGVLLYGPPGCGKTMIAKAVANETEAYFAHITGPEIVGKFYGESEARLRAVFEEARAKAPAIIFIDEIDAIAPRREDMGAEKQVERRMVAQLLALMDGLESRGEVIVIGATNIPNSLDPALRRPGRFDREIGIRVPDQPARLDILQIHTRGMPLAEDVDLERLSQVTHGFVGADLEALCREAAMSALRGILPQIDFQLHEIPYDVLLKLDVRMDNFTDALKEVEPSAIREVFVDVPNVGWDEVGGLEQVKRALKEAVEWPLKYPGLFAEARVAAAKGILLFGPPGTGKTLVAKALATESDVNFISVRGPELMSRYVGESERGVREVFRKARQASPCILFFDEFDSLVPRRGGSSSSDAVERVISQFLTELDGIEELRGVVVLAATNRADLIDPAVLRPGRFDLLLEFPLPDERAREQILEVWTRHRPVAEDVSLGALACETDGLAGSEIESACRQAAMAAIREALADVGGDVRGDIRGDVRGDIRGGAHEGRAGHLRIRSDHFREAIRMVKGWRG